MQLFYYPLYKNDKTITLDKEESAHIAKVLRYKEGQTIYITDGKGLIMQAKILQTDAKHCIVEIIDKQEKYQKRDYYIHLAIAPTKNINRMEWLIEKAVEIGIDEITPLITEHSERKFINSERLEKIIISAMKQSIKSVKPKLNPITKFYEFIVKAKEEKKYLCCCSDNEKILIKKDYKPKQSTLIMIGPEGDFSQKEIDLSKKYNFTLITLGSMRLRTETAALYAIANIHFLNQ